MKERPILFSGSMVRALLDGRKKQTRRVVKPQPSWDGRWFSWQGHAPNAQHGACAGNSLDTAQLMSHSSPYGKPGDQLYVRETWQHSNHPLGPYDEDCLVFYRADYLDDPLGPDLELSTDGIRRQWRPSIHMPRAASRITLEVTGVRVERLQDISEADARAEGCDPEIVPACCGEPSFESHGVYGTEIVCCGTPVEDESYVAGYRNLWDSLNAERGYGWDVNPWVWVVKFNRIGS